MARTFIIGVPPVCHTMFFITLVSKWGDNNLVSFNATKTSVYYLQKEIHLIRLLLFWVYLFLLQTDWRFLTLSVDLKFGANMESKVPTSA